jgi:hypothetical protein
MDSAIRTHRLVFAAFASMFFISTSNAAVIVSHSGAVDPTGEGFGPFQTFGGVEGTDQTHGASTGAWNIDTTPGTTNHYGFYERPHSGADITALSDPSNSVLFTMTFKILVDETRDVNGSFAVSGAFSIGSNLGNTNNNEWLFLMGLNATDDLVIRPFLGSPMTFASGLNTFHTLRLEDLDGDDVSGIAGLQRDFDIYVDNVFQFTWAGAPGTPDRLFFGEASGNEAQATSVDWSVFRLETAPIAVPEPNSLVLLMIGLVPMLRRLRMNGVK